MSATNLLGLEGKAALVVGGGSGIGRATSLMLGNAGADVVVADVDPDRAREVRAEVRATGVRCEIATGDVTVADQADAVVAAAVDALDGRLDVLINIVGMAAWTKLFELDDATWDLDMTRNLRQHLYVARSAARRMVDAGTPGRMALVASVSGIYGAPNHGAYGAAKAGLMALVRTMANEWGQHGIRVNAIAPDGINTPRVAASRAARGVDNADAAAHERFLLGRFGTPEEIAGPLVFMVSDLSGFVTGQTLIVDGGRRVVFPTAMPTM